MIELFPSLLLLTTGFGLGWFLRSIILVAEHPVTRYSKVRTLRTVKTTIYREKEMDPAQVDPELRYIKISRWDTNVYRTPEDEVESNPRFGEVDAA